MPFSVAASAGGEEESGPRSLPVGATGEHQLLLNGRFSHYQSGIFKQGSDFYVVLFAFSFPTVKNYWSRFL